MAWEGSNRSKRLPPDWQSRRLRVLRRDGYRCQERTHTGILCAQPAGEVDHIERGDNHDERNLRAICKACHAKKTAREGVEARPARARPPRKHPGLI